VHSLGSSAEDLFALAPRLAKLRRCVLVDLFGSGFSVLPEAGYTPEFFASALEEQDGRLGLKRSAWLGYSLGGLVVLWLATHRPNLTERVATPALGRAVAPGERALIRTAAPGCWPTRFTRTHLS
jgi:pimeloyl-ACP methyl ester carboxylesterase